MRRLLLVIMPLALLSAPASARDVVDASEPEALSVTVYRDPNRREGQEMNRNWPQGFAMISETRTVTLPAGESTIRFDGVAEGMVAVSAIVTGLPGGTIEKNRNADLLSPASLVDGTLGNRVQITRTNPATGTSASEDAVIRTRADGGLVLQTHDGYEAVRCSGLPEKLTFDSVPEGLSADPVFSIDTRDPAGGTYQVTLTYLAWGFDWQANYVATLDDTGAKGKVGLRLLSWLTVLNDNGQSFPDADLMAVAGTINVESDFRGLSDPPTARPLRLTCYPLGSTAAGTAVHSYATPVAVPPPMAMAPMEATEDRIVVTASRMQRKTELAVVASEEQLGDLKLYRIPETMTVAAKGLKQVAFLNKEQVQGEFLYVANCDPYTGFADIDDSDNINFTQILLTMKNEEEKGLGAALPMGGMALFEPGPAGTQLVAELDMRDYAVGQDIELELGASTQVFSKCGRMSERQPDDSGRQWTRMKAEMTNANNHPVRMRIVIGYPENFDVRWPRKKARVKNGQWVVEINLPANSRTTHNWQIRHTDAYLADR
ncbi:hypothetical protein QWY75_02665 [Pontixanthobacter aestiaquae]|uniref:DUF4139 domain-containing protein n=1 Tax=Pontixanthobacter aestiaquae TaxID=1509367 RepID=A0A844ZA31_9SPHN|nr:hypothetical protein [Pontixanthobacter aestiaquae]MDN3645107.1 hypothetical protein [Pontixanthobacter aestiaquae]MXO83893.1 hypothetical protein [Pontixanthobacter aestiaquae]